MRNDVWILAMLLIVVGMVPAVAVADERPNILFIMSDDHAAHAIGAYGSRLAVLDPTPVIDTLAQQGVRFNNCYVTNSICTPSRACIISGQYNHVNGVHDLGGRIVPENQHLAIEMRKAGYQTAMVGKWHLKEEPNFDYYKVLPGQGKYHDPSFRDQEAGAWPNNMVTMEGHSSDRITDITLDWLKKRDRTKPFFLMHHYKAPHDMFENARRYDTYLEDVAIPEPASMWSQPNFGSIATRGHEDECLGFIGTSIGRRHVFRNYTRSWAKDPDLTDEEAKRLAYNVYMKKYLRCVKGVDDNLGRLFAYLKEEGLFDKTIIIYTGDQGFMLGEHDYMDKRWMYEPSQRMPFLVRYPNAIKPGTQSDAIIENVDFGPTMLDFAGVETPDYMQGRSFRKICETTVEPDGWKQAAYYRYWMHMAHHWNPAHVGLRTKQYKLIYYYGCDMKGGNQTPPGWELYDVVDDPHEVTNLYDDPQYADVIVKLKKQLAQRRAEIKDDDEPFPEMRAVIEEFWDYDEADRAKAIEISHEYAARERSRMSGRKPSRPKAVMLPGGYIKPAASKLPLVEHDGLKEISRTATYKMSHPGPGGFNVDNAFLLSGDAPSIKPHAFHSAEMAEQPFIVVKLDQPRQVGALKIVNRKESLHERAAGLTVWISADEKQWQKVWQAEKPAAEWLVDVATETACRYIKIGLPHNGTLHLNKVTVFGR